MGDPGRGERIAEAVLDDDAARAEIVSPITSSVMSSTGLPADQQPFVAAQVDRLLQDPAGAQAFIDPFAGEWARMLGAADPRPSLFDVTPFIDDIVAAAPGLDPAAIPTDQLVTPSVPLPTNELSWLGKVRDVVTASIMPLAVAAVVGFAFAFAFGDRRRALRRAGIWGVCAGAGWVIVPLVVVWAARRWATGADAVVAIAVEEAVSGLQPTAIVLLVSGVAAIAGSFAMAMAPARAEPDARTATTRSSVTATTTAATRSPHPRRAAPPPAPVRRQPVDRTALLPEHAVAQSPPTTTSTPTALWKYYS